MKYFVTGGTGFIGSHFIVDQAASHEIHVLVRGDDVDSARERLGQKVGVAAAAYGEPDVAVDVDALDVVLGDVEAPDLGIAPEPLARLRATGIDIFWHFAANLNFERDKAERIERVNVGGVRHTLDLARALGARRFVYVSTAYTAGEHEGRVEEELHDPAGPFNNSYEQSKCAAEHLVADFCAAHGMAFNILRPSVIIGVSTTKQSGGSKTGLYAFIRDLFHLKKAADVLDIEPSFSADPDIVINFNPVDGVIADIRWLVDNDFPGGPVRHLTASYGVRLLDGINAITEAVGLDNFRVTDEVKEARTPIDELIGARARSTRATSSTPRTSPAPSPATTAARWTTSGVTSPRTSSTCTSDIRRRGSPPCPSPCPTASPSTATPAPPDRNGRRSSSSPPSGSPSTCGCASSSRPGSTTTSTPGKRYLPGTAPLLGTDISPARHVLDGIEVLNHHGVKEAHVVGWCTGGKLALRLAAEHPERVRSLTTLSGGFNIADEALRTPYELHLIKVLTEIAAEPALAQLYYDLVYHGGQQDEQSDREVRSLLHDTNADYVQFTSIPFQSPENIERYARLISAFYEDTDLGPVEGMTVPTLTIAARTDGNTHPDASRHVSARVCGARCFEFDEGDHYLMDSQTPAVYEQFRQHALAAEALSAGRGQDDGD